MEQQKFWARKPSKRMKQSEKVSCIVGFKDIVSWTPAKQIHKRTWENAWTYAYAFIPIQKITVEKVVGEGFKPFDLFDGLQTSFKPEKISKIIVKKDMLILRTVDFQNSSRSIHFNHHSYTLQVTTKAFEWIITFWNPLHSCSPLGIEQRDFSCSFQIKPCVIKRNTQESKMLIFFAPGRFVEVTHVIIWICNNCQHSHIDYKSNKNVCVAKTR